MRHHLIDAGKLGAVGLQEFPARRSVVEQLLYLDGGALRATGLAHHRPLAAFDRDKRARLTFPGQRRQADAGHRPDARQRLAAKAERADGFQIPRLSNLAGGVAEERQPRVRQRLAN